jgi:hypothetical protein
VECAESQRREAIEAVELLQQVRAAQAAEASAVLARQQAIIAAWALAAGVVTAAAAIGAAFFARSAASEAIRSNQVAIENSRARILITLENFQREGVATVFEICVTNVGGSGCLVTSVFAVWGEREEHTPYMMGRSHTFPAAWKDNGGIG